MSPAPVTKAGGIEIVVVGAGIAGLSAAARLREAGRRVLVLEAGSRIGGRAVTQAGVDLGAQWLHAAEHNPLVPLLRAHGETIGEDSAWEDRVHVFDEHGAPIPYEILAAAEAHWHAAVEARLGAADISLAEAASAVAAAPWSATIETWEGAIIAAADADVLSLRDWHDNALEGSNGVVAGGLGAALARVLGPLAGELRLGAAVVEIAEERDGVRVVLADGSTVEAGAAIVTVSTGVLREGGIAFLPALPERTTSALAGLPMGLLSKVIFRAAGAERLGLKPGSVVFRRVTSSGAPAVSLLFWPQGAPVLMAFIGGRAAWALEGRPDAAAQMVRQELRKLFGEAALDAFAPGPVATSWGDDPHFRGAYAYAVPGSACARAALAEPVWQGLLCLAGEACATNGHAGTVAGAYASGRNAADCMMRPRTGST